VRVGGAAVSLPVDHARPLLVALSALVASAVPDGADEAMTR
jgi:hypothetical protein